MLRLPPHLAELIHTIADHIDPADLATDQAQGGYVDDPHLTLRFDCDPSVRPALGEIPITLHPELDAFLNADSGDGHDVLFAPLEDGTGVMAARDQLPGMAGAANSRPFHAHVSIAYLRPGTAAKYVDRLKLPPEIRSGQGRPFLRDSEGVEHDLAGVPDATFAAEPDIPSPVPIPGVGKPASGEVALAGADGHDLNRLIRDAKDHGTEVLNKVAESATRRAWAEGKVPTKGFLDAEETAELAEALSSVLATADLLGRSRVREHADKVAKGMAGFADKQSETFAATPTIRIMPPPVALDYFRTLFPDMNLDPVRFGESMRRDGFSLAAATDTVMAARVQDAITQALEAGYSSNEATGAIEDILDAAGVSVRNPDYSSMVFRTNAMDAYQTAAYEEARAPDIREAFPVWRYLGIDDARAGADHRPHFGKYYPASVSFNEVRGDRPFNCRCSLAWVDAAQWDELLKAGSVIETSW